MPAVGDAERVRKWSACSQSVRPSPSPPTFSVASILVGQWSLKEVVSGRLSTILPMGNWVDERRKCLFNFHSIDYRNLVLFILIGSTAEIKERLLLILEVVPFEDLPSESFNKLECLKWSNGFELNFGVIVNDKLLVYLT